jgi:hypothetical protein
VVFVAVLIGVAVLAGLAIFALRRRGSDEVHSVAGYQHRLERLEEVRRRQSGSVRVIGGTAQRPEAPQRPVVGEDGRIEISSSSASRRVFDDTGQLPRSPNRPPPAAYRRRRDVSIARMGHRPRRLGAPIAAAVAVIVLVTGLAIAGAHSRGHSTTTTTTAPKKHQNTTTTTRPPVTTVPSTFTPSSTSGNVATYTLPFASYTVAFTATNGGCYIQITNAAGSTPYAQVLASGATEQLVLTGTSKIVLGAPSRVTISVDRTPVTFPNPIPAPLDITFVGATPSGSSTTTSTA